MSEFQLLLLHTRRLSAHVNQGRAQEALAVFHKIMASPSLTPDPYVISLGLKAITLLHLHTVGSSVHARACVTGLLASPFVSSSLIHMYGKCVSLSAARFLFDQVPNRNVVVWNTLISLHCLSGQVSDAIRLFDLMEVPPITSSFNSIIAALSNNIDSQAFEFFRRMRLLGVRPNLITILALLPACVGLSSLASVKEIHGFSLRNYIYPHPYLSSGLVEAYGRCGCLRNSGQVFGEMPRKDVVAWSAMVSAYALHGEAALAFRCFMEMERDEGVVLDGVAFLSVLKACSHAGSPDEALRYFSRMRLDYGIEAGSDHYACLVDVLGRAGRLSEAYEVIREMPMKRSAKAWGALLHGCRTYGEVELAEIAGRVLFEIEPDNAGNYVLLASIYARAGRFHEAEMVRMDMMERGVKALPGSSWVGSRSRVELKPGSLAS